MPRHERRRRAARSTATRRRRVLALIGSVLVIGLLAVGGFAVSKYLDLSNGIHRSAISLPKGTGAAEVSQNTNESNILVMGLDSRVDQYGQPLPAQIYNAIHAGDQSDGGYNANVLMLIHIPAGSGKAVGISVPRDDYAPLAGSPDGVAKSKIKEAYGLALDQKLRQLRNQGIAQADAYQQARDAGRQAEIQTVSNFLGGVRIDHFIEVTMAAFYKVAQAVQPITVCLNHATQDKYSGANFPAGVQQIDASQAMSFVRQRRDTGPSSLNLTDLDRTRRQQAFIVSLAYKLRQADTFTNFGTLQSLIDTAKQYVALDSGFDLLSFASQAQRLAAGNITFETLPIRGYGTIDGKDVNLVDTAQIQSQVRSLLHPVSATPSTSTVTSRAPTATPETPQPSPGTSVSAPPANTYTDSATPLQSGAVPCVN